MSRTNVARHGRVFVMRRMCDDCIFRPGNLMGLSEGRVEDMVREATESEGVIPCHRTLHRRPKAEAVCHGYFRLHAPAPLQIAERLGFIEWADQPEGS